jgi:predicted DNA-binding protein YlxM (UPF0122 family)
MGRGKKAEEAKAKLFKRLYGVTPDTFDKMKLILENGYDVLHKDGGKPPKLTVEDKLYISLKYLREYRTMDSIAADYCVSKSTVCESIQWVENTLAQDKTFSLPGKRVLKRKSAAIEYIVVDITESPINRPKKTKKSTIQGKRSVIH